MGEQWRPIAGWDGYEVSDQGRVRSWRIRGYKKDLSSRASSPRVLALCPVNERGHLMAVLTYACKSWRPLVHHLVLEAFVGPRPPGLICRHLDDDPRNNRVENLAWGTYEENAADAFRNGGRAARRERPPDFHNDPFLPVEALLPWEVWRSIPDCPGYEVSSFGRVRSYWTKGNRPRIAAEPRVLKPGWQKYGHRHVGLKVRGGKHKTFSLHRVVLEAFSPRPEPHLICRHVDNDPSNNHIRNLKWGTAQENQWDRTDNLGEDCRNARLTWDEVDEIRARKKAGETGAALAEEFGVSRSMIGRIHRGLAWRKRTNA